MNILSQFLPSLSSGPLLRIIGACLILVFGHLFVKILGRAVRKISLNTDSTKKALQLRREKIGVVENLMDAIVIILALGYLNVGINIELQQALLEKGPRLFSVLLIGVLGVTVIKIIEKFSKDFFQAMGVQKHISDGRKSSNSINIVSLGLKVFLYLILAQVIFSQLQVNITALNQLLNASAWAFAFLIAALIFTSLKDLVRNLGAGLYLRNSSRMRPGEKLHIGDEKGEIRSVDTFSTEIETDGGYTMITQNSEVVNKNLKFKRTRNDIETLEDIKEYFIAQDPSYCGPASAEMALSIFGYKYTQEQIGRLCGTEVGKGTMPQDLIDSVEELTDGEVKADYVEYEKISNLSDEFKAWFNDGALIIPNFAKPVLFPQADTAHYSLCVGVEENELLIVDPSADTVSGGVYYADSSEMLEAMAEFDGRSRGYLVLAPEDTTAYWRITKGLIYADESFYDQLNKNMELQLRRMLRQGRILKNVLPDQFQKYVEDWKKEERVERLWKPENRKSGDDNNEQSTDSS